MDVVKKKLALGIRFEKMFISLRREGRSHDSTSRAQHTSNVENAGEPLFVMVNLRFFAAQLRHSEAAMHN